MMDCIKSKYILSDSEEYEFRLILNELIANGTVHGIKGCVIKPLQLKWNVLMDILLV